MIDKIVFMAGALYPVAIEIAGAGAVSSDTYIIALHIMVVGIGFRVFSGDSDGQT